MLLSEDQWSSAPCLADGCLCCPVQTFANSVGTCAHSRLLLEEPGSDHHVLRWFEEYATALDTGYFQVGCRYQSFLYMKTVLCLQHARSM